MENKSSSDSSISLDSLEVGNGKKSTLKAKTTKENVQTILVPFYEKDVLIKIPKLKKKIKQNVEKRNKNEDKLQESRSYLVNKDAQRSKKASYLEMFRKQFSTNHTEVHNNIDHTEIRSISPQVGDTPNESIGGESTNAINDFYNTEAYNEIYYEKVLNGELERYLNESFEQALNFDEDIMKLEDTFNNLRSVSEVSQPRRHVRRLIEPQIHNVRLGGLGPDMENIKPRLERARSLQRYSEKVRMENRVKIYKKGLEAKNETKVEAIDTRKNSSNKKSKQYNDTQNSYLVNKTLQDNSSIIKKVYHTKSKSADLFKKRDKEKEAKLKDVCNNESQKEGDPKRIKNHMKILSAKDRALRDNIDGRHLRAKSSAKTREIHMETKQNVPPVQINFLVNVGEVRPSSTLKSLEEKHRLYQEKVKSFTNTKNT
ncbi:unnamed protein product, partial [Brenthis ino]